MWLAFQSDLATGASLARAVGGSLTLLLLLLALPLAHEAGRRLTGTGVGRAGRLSACLVLVMAGLMAVFHLLAVPGFFLAPVAGMVWAGLLLLLARFLFGADLQAGFLRAGRRLRSDATFWISGSGTQGWSGLTLLGCTAVMLCAVFLFLRWGRAVLAPPMVWDEIGYHLVKSGRWVSDGAWLHYPAPDCWQAWEYFPAFGSMLWAWFALGTHDLTLVWVPVVGAWMLLVLGTVHWARVLGASRRASLAAGLLMGLNPMPLAVAGITHVDILGSGLLAAGMGFVAVAVGRLGKGRVGRGDVAGPAFLGACAAACAMGTKQTFMPMALVGGVTLVGALIWHRGRGLTPRGWAGLIVGVLLAIALGSIPYLRGWIEMGNPVHPFPSPLGPGDRQQVAVMDGTYTPMDEELKTLSWVVISTMFRAYFYDWENLVSRHPIFPEDFVNFGPGGLLLLVLGVMGWVLARSSQPARLRAGQALGLGIVGIVAVSYLSHLAINQRTIWQDYSGRFALPAWVVFAVFAAQLGWERVLRIALPVALLVGWPYSFPFGIDFGREWPFLAAGLLLGGAVVGCGLLVLGGFLQPSRRSMALILLGGAGWFVVVPVSSSLRQAARQPYHSLIAAGQAFTVHALSPRHRLESRIWNAVDGLPPSRIAMTADFAHQGQNWYRLPLMGGRFQHQVVYVSPWAGGEIVDGDAWTTHGLQGGRTDKDLWIQRLRAQGVTHVMAAGPKQEALIWLESSPDVFQPLVVTENGLSQLFALRPGLGRSSVPGALPRADIDSPFGAHFHHLLPDEPTAMTGLFPLGDFQYQRGIGKWFLGDWFRVLRGMGFPMGRSASSHFEPDDLQAYRSQGQVWAHGRRWAEGAIR